MSQVKFTCRLAYNSSEWKAGHNLGNKGSVCVTKRISDSTERESPWELSEVREGNEEKGDT